jgi:hypothetical protein
VNGAISEITALHSIFSSHGTGTVIQADKHRSLDHALRSHRLRVERHDGIDNTYRDAVDGIYQYTDDSIQFPRMICDELIDYGNRLRQRYKQQFRGSVRKIPHVDWGEPEAKGLFPPRERYATWYTHMLYAVRPTEGMRLEKFKVGVRRFGRKWLGVVRAKRKLIQKSRSSGAYC